MEVFQESKAKLTVYVHPSNASDVRRAIARQLSSILCTCVPYSSPNLNLSFASLLWVHALGRADPVAQMPSVAQID
jgi:hypothetical protein